MEQNRAWGRGSVIGKTAQPSYRGLPGPAREQAGPRPAKLDVASVSHRRQGLGQGARGPGPHSCARSRSKQGGPRRVTRAGVGTPGGWPVGGGSTRLRPGVRQTPLAPGAVTTDTLRAPPPPARVPGLGPSLLVSAALGPPAQGLTPRQPSAQGRRTSELAVSAYSFSCSSCSRDWPPSPSSWARSCQALSCSRCPRAAPSSPSTLH